MDYVDCQLNNFGRTLGKCFLCERANDGVRLRSGGNLIQVSVPSAQLEVINASVRTC